jgi:hypothetical protein
MTILIIAFFILITITGFFTLKQSFLKAQKRLEFTNKYRNCFVEFANNFYKTYDKWDRQGEIEHEKYVWLTMNGNKMQGMLGMTGIMGYIAPFQRYTVSNYNIVLNTIPKFRDKSITEFEVNSTDDCLLRYIGITDEIVKDRLKQVKNPFLWIKQGFTEFFSLPIYLLNWFGILPDRFVGRITSNMIFKILTGIGGLVTFISGLVTIIQGKDQAIEFFKRIFNK